MELHTLGDTSAYSLRDVQEVARVFSGWTIGEEGSGAEGEFVFRAADHDDGEKVFLGQRFPAGQGQRDGDQLLGFLAGHPLTARFIAGKLCQRFLGAAPPQLRERMTKMFFDTQGDIRSVVGELVRSDEFCNVPSSDSANALGDGAVLKRPFQFAVSALRMLGARTSGAGVVPHLEAMGQRPFAWPQPNGYPLRANYWSTGLLSRWKFAIDLARNTIDETWIDLGTLERATRGKPAVEVCRRLSKSLLPTPLRTADLEAIAAIGQSVEESGGTAQNALSRCLALFLMSPQFQWC